MARVVRKQDHDRPLVEVAADQALFQFDNESGVLVGECWAQGREGRGAYAMAKRAGKAAARRGKAREKDESKGRGVNTYNMRHIAVQGKLPECNLHGGMYALCCKGRATGEGGFSAFWRDG